MSRRASRKAELLWWLLVVTTVGMCVGLTMLVLALDPDGPGSRELTVLRGRGPDPMVDVPQVIVTEEAILIHGVPSNLREDLSRKREFWQQTHPGEVFPGQVMWFVQKAATAREFRWLVGNALAAGYPEQHLLLQTEHGSWWRPLPGPFENSMLAASVVWTHQQCASGAPVVWLGDHDHEPLSSLVSALLRARGSGPRQCWVVGRNIAELPEQAHRRRERLSARVMASAIDVDQVSYRSLTISGPHPRLFDLSNSGPTEVATRVELLNLAELEGIDDFEALDASLKREGRKLVFAMNAGMYHADRSPVGLLVHQGQQHAKLNTDEGRGNFFLLPNGVFAAFQNTFVVAPSSSWDQMERAGPLDRPAWHRMLIHGTEHDEATERWLLDRRLGKDETDRAIPFEATQSGPLLIHKGKLHPKLDPRSSSRRIRNGVGVNSFGDAVFVISSAPVTFHEFARFFQMLGCQDALYLDGTVSALYAPALGRRDSGKGLGPVVVVSELDPQALPSDSPPTKGKRLSAKELVASLAGEAPTVPQFRFDICDYSELCLRLAGQTYLLDRTATHLSAIQRTANGFEVNYHQGMACQHPERSLAIDASAIASRLANTLAYRLHAQNQFDASARGFATALQLDSDNEMARTNLACALAQLGRSEDALTLLLNGQPLGIESYLTLLSDSDLEPLRRHPEVRAFEAKQPTDLRLSLKDGSPSEFGIAVSEEKGWIATVARHDSWGAMHSEFHLEVFDAESGKRLLRTELASFLDADPSTGRISPEAMAKVQKRLSTMSTMLQKLGFATAADDEQRAWRHAPPARADGLDYADISVAELEALRVGTYAERVPTQLLGPAYLGDDVVYLPQHDVVVVELHLNEPEGCDLEKDIVRTIVVPVKPRVRE